MLRQKTCENCNTRNSDANKHCENCGMPLDTEALAQLERKRQTGVRGSGDINKLFDRPSNVKPIMLGICIGVIIMLIAFGVFIETNRVIWIR